MESLNKIVLRIFDRFKKNPSCITTYELARELEEEEIVVVEGVHFAESLGVILNSSIGHHDTLEIDGKNIKEDDYKKFEEIPR